MEEPEIIVGSRTQDAETLQRILNDDGYQDIELNSQSDTLEAVEDVPQPAAPTEIPVPSSESGDDAGEDDEDESAGTPGADSETANPAAPSAPKKGKGGYQKKIGKLESRIDELTRQLEEQRSSAVADEAIPDETPEPQLDDVDETGEAKYASYEDYTKALGRWTYGQARRDELLSKQTARKKKAEETTTKAVDDTAKKRWNEQLEVGKANHDDFEEVMRTADKLEAAEPLTEAIHDSDMQAELVYYLATHPDELKALNQKLNLPKDAPIEDFRKKMRVAYRELERLEGLASQSIGTHAAPGPQATPVATEPARESRPAAAPKAKPEPIRPVGNRGGAIRRTVEQMSPDEIRNMDNDDYRKLRGL